MDDAAHRGELSLAAVQRWMQAATTHPAGLGPGLALADARHGLDIAAVVDTPAGVDARRRLAIYADGYWIRLISCLETEFPALRRMLGPQLFGFFARSYLNRHPSRSPSLHTLGAQFPAFLLHSQRRAANGARRPPTQTFALDLARLERAIAESGRAVGREAQAQAAVPADDLWGLALLAGDAYAVSLPDTTRLLALRHAADSFRPWLRGQESHEPAEYRRDYVAIRRLQFRVSMERLADWQFFALRHAARRAATLSDCTRAAARRTRRPEGEIRAELALWLPTAQLAGLVVLTPN
ncbi:HvfC/BufC N-terminal domain-containing protein [Burkholderia plantarii]|uniref:HvfC/BufC N-terminal domain-containing protein n=1 Tax=Burkholderia plantarii TaxID=41899 RepID=UPI0018DCCA16|nr:DNA-binding domain-containing protein [Burkholderia plantarii]MBI0329560.1 putative DNA-binding domain-containing protein [Burkholderia plantarii]